MAFSRTLRFHEGLGSTYDGARRQMLAKMDDDAYQSFVQSFKFCHECRQFVCSECWSNSRRTCLGCFAKAAGTSVRPKPPFAPEGPAIPRPAALTAPVGRRRRLRTDASLLVMGAALLLLVAEIGFIILPSAVGGSSGSSPSASAPIAIVPTASPSASATMPTDPPTANPTDTAAPTADPTDTAAPTAGPTATPTATPSPTASPTPTKAPTAAPTIRITPKPAPTAFPTPRITCSKKTIADGGSQTCTWTNSSGVVFASARWYLNNTNYAYYLSPSGKSLTFAVSIADYTTDQCIHVVVKHGSVMTSSGDYCYTVS
jgi:hypothetical protein